MDIKEIVDKMKIIQTNLLEFLDHEDDQEENYEKLIEDLNNLIKENKQQEIKAFLYILSNIARNHYRYPKFIDKIEKILLLLKDTIKNNYSNSQIYNFFKGNNLILLFLIEEKMLIIDQNVYSKMKRNNKIKFFSPEINKFLNKESDEDKQMDDFYKKRKIGENDDYICQLIQKDNIEDFIIHVNKADIPLKSQITPSIFETNSFLIKRKPTLIEYAAFFGSIQIFKYIFSNIGDLSKSQLWFYSIHSDSPEMINFIEEIKISPKDVSFMDCFGEAVKCHHNNIANYIHSNYLDKSLQDDPEFSLMSAIQYHNFLFFDCDYVLDEWNFSELCKYDYPFLVEALLKTKEVDVNRKLINKLMFF